MYPANFFNLFPSHPQKNQVFVAMSFSPEFQPRWEKVIRPSIEAVRFAPYRVDISKINDSILTDILVGIGNSRLIFADISESNGVRNGNVMYEVGIAHAIRQPQEVVLFRSDRGKLLFDLSTIRVHRYDPDSDIGTSRELVTEVLSNALSESEKVKSLAAQRATNGLDHNCVYLLIEAVREGSVIYPPLNTVGQTYRNMPRVLSLHRLLEAGLMNCSFPQVTIEELQEGKLDVPLEKFLSYQVTPLGKAVLVEFLRRAGTLDDPEIQKRLEQLYKGKDGGN